MYYGHFPLIEVYIYSTFMHISLWLIFNEIYNVTRDW